MVKKLTVAQEAAGKQIRFTDTRLDEQARAMSIKMMPMSLVMESHSGKSFLLNLLDCPGHVNFNDEVGLHGGMVSNCLLASSGGRRRQVNGFLCRAEGRSLCNNNTRSCFCR